MKPATGNPFIHILKYFELIILIFEIFIFFIEWFFISLSLKIFIVFTFWNLLSTYKSIVFILQVVIGKSIVLPAWVRLNVCNRHVTIFLIKIMVFVLCYIYCIILFWILIKICILALRCESYGFKSGTVSAILYYWVLFS